MSNAEIVVVGAGVAGLSAALAVADAGQDVTLVPKADLVESNTYHAQGGIAAAVFAGETLLFFRIECAHGSVCAKFTRVPAPRLFRRRRTVCKSVQRYGLFFTICHIFAIYLIAYEIQF